MPHPNSPGRATNDGPPTLQRLIETGRYAVDSEGWFWRWDRPQGWFSMTDFSPSKGFWMHADSRDVDLALKDGYLVRWATEEETQA